MNGTEKPYIEEAFAENWIAPLGKHVDAFERETAARLGMEHGAALSSGTAAIHLALKAAGVGQGDVVFCSDFTFSASCNPIVYQNATPVFIDSERDSWNMDPAMLRRGLEKYPQAKAVIVVNLYGTPANLSEIAAICGEFGVDLIEDAAESLGSSWQGKPTGAFGRMGILSFNGNKIITTSGGGMLLGHREEDIKNARFWATQARDPAPWYQHSQLGYNYRLSNICAGIGRGQLTTLDERVRQKTAIYQKYQAAFAGHEWISLNPIPEGAVCNHWLSCIVLGEGCPVSFMDIYDALAGENIESRPLWKPMSLQPFYEDCDFISREGRGKSVGGDLFSRGLCLPSDVNMSQGDQDRVIDIVLDLF